MSARDEILTNLFDWNPWLEGKFPKELAGFPRSIRLEPYLKIPEVKILEGARRVGKSTLFYQLIQRILKRDKRVLYVNFEDEILKKYKLSEIIDAYCSVGMPRYLFIDEVQNCVDWVAFVRKAHDRKEIPQIWISGSNSSFIKKEFATLLTGRNVTIKVYPLSFDEYVRFKGVKLFPRSSRKLSAIKKLFHEYLGFGAFPAVVLRPVLQKELLISYFEDFVYKDIASRHDVNVNKIKELGIYLATNSAKSFSYRGCAAALRMHPKTSVDYCSYFSEIFLFYELYKFDYALKNQMRGEKKMYIADTGLASAISFRFSEDCGRMLENVVHNALKAGGEEIYFHKQKYECDFLIKKDLKISHAIQVAYSLKDREVKKREFRGLVEAMQYHQLLEGTILTIDEEGEEEIVETNARMHIRILPAWKWLLNYQEIR